MSQHNGAILLVRTVNFKVINTPINQRKAQKLIEQFSEQWADAFNSSLDIPSVHGEPWKKEVNNE